MQENLIYIILGIVVGLIIGYMISKVYFRTKIKSQRKQAVNKSRSVTLGNVSEAIAPLLPNFPYQYKDIMFLGKGVDYIVFDGLSQGYVKEIIFLEVKSGQSQLNKNERLIKDCVQRGKVSYDLFRLKY